MLPLTVEVSNTIRDDARVVDGAWAKDAGGQRVEVRAQDGMLGVLGVLGVFGVGRGARVDPLRLTLSSRLARLPGAKAQQVRFSSAILP